MNNDIAIKISNLTKIYHLYDKPQDRLKEALNPFKKSYHNDFYAMDDVSFEIKKGDTVGIIGKNGAGKSTLLKMITGVLTPTLGGVETNGKIASLLELGGAFNPEMTGIENIYLNGTLMGFSKVAMDNKIDAILEFADIGSFVHQKVKTYSSGMFARLSFSVAINVEPDILIVDEVLSVGDMRFQQKCFRKFREFQDNNKTILFVTHDTSSIINYCTEVIWLEGGKKIDEGKPDLVCKRYISMMSYNQESKETVSPVATIKGVPPTDVIRWVKTEQFESFGEKKILITEVALVSENGGSVSVLEGGENITLKMKMKSLDRLTDLIVGFIVYDSLGGQIFGSNTEVHNYGKLSFNENEEYVVDFSFKMPLLRRGDFTISPAIAEGTQGTHIQHHWVHDAIEFNINPAGKLSTVGWMLAINDIKIKVY